MSQRTFTFLLLVLLAVVIAAAAYYNGLGVVIGEDLNETLLALAAPLTLVATTILGVFEVIDARVKEGKLKAGDIPALFMMPEWWVGMIASVSGLLQLFDFKVLPPDTQTILVNLGLALATLLLRSLSNRPASSEQDSTTLVATKVYRQRVEG